MITTYPLTELRAALRELDAGTFMQPPEARGAANGLDRLPPATVGVLGIGGGIGTTVVALAIAEAIGANRLIELCPHWFSGLVEATTAELGTDQGWRLGNRKDMLIERRDADTAAVRDVPGEKVVVDFGTWSGSAPDLEPPVAALVLVAPCTIPGMRRLGNLLSSACTGGHIFAVLIGAAPGKALPKALIAAAGQRVEAMLDNGHLVTIPTCASLRRAGITSDPLPKAVLASIKPLALQLKDVLT